MTLPFAIVFLSMLGIQSINLKSLMNKYGKENIWATYMLKFLAVPLWTALTFAGPLGILQGFLLMLVTILLTAVFAVILAIVLLRKDPTLAVHMEDPEYQQDRANIFNCMSLVAGLILLVGSLAGVLTMV